MNVRALPVIGSLLATLLLLFGSWYGYQQYFVQRPVESFIKSQPGVELRDISMTNHQVTVDVDFKDAQSFPNDYKNIYDYIYNKTGITNIQIRLPKMENQLSDLWDEEYFSLAEAVRLKEYSRIPAIMDELKQKKHLEETISRMDDKNIYIYLKDGAKHYYAVLPIAEEVASNE